MKIKLKILLTSFCLLSLAYGLSSCHKKAQKDTTADFLVGEWQIDDQKQDASIKLLKDGSVEINAKDLKDFASFLYFVDLKWSYKEPILEIRLSKKDYLTAEIEKLPEQNEDVIEVKNIKGQYLGTEKAFRGSFRLKKISNP